MNERWQNQEEAYQFALNHPVCMLDMDMGTGKTRTTIDIVYERSDAHRVLVVCPKAVISVWRENLKKFAPDSNWACWDRQNGTIAGKSEDLKSWIKTVATKQFIIINYDSVWRNPMGDTLLKLGINMVVLDESHRAKSAGSKVSKYLAMLGKRVKYRMCLSGTPMANSPLDVYGQYRFLDPSIFGTNHHLFLQEYAILGGPDHNFIVGFKNQNKLNEKFKSIAYTCKMSDIADRIKLPPALPPMRRLVQIPSKDMKTSNILSKEFIAECGQGDGVITVSNVLVKMLRLQQIAAGFCYVQDNPAAELRPEELNTAKEDALVDMLEDISPRSSVVVFCVFKHDLEAVARASEKAKRKSFELSGRINELGDWKECDGGVIAVQIQAGAEGVDMTKANHAVYFSIPHSLALYNQSKARLYRPNQTNSVSFYHLIAERTIDESMYDALTRKEDVIDAIKSGSFNFGFIK